MVNKSACVLHRFRPSQDMLVVLGMRKASIKRRTSVRGTRSAREQWEDGDSAQSRFDWFREEVTVAVKCLFTVSDIGFDVGCWM